MKTEYIEILERLKNKQRRDHMKGAITGSVQANNRLMKELRDIYNSDTFKKGIISFTSEYFVSIALTIVVIVS